MIARVFGQNYRRILSLQLKEVDLPWCERDPDAKFPMNDLPPQSGKDRRQFRCQKSRIYHIWQMRLNSGILRSEQMECSDFGHNWPARGRSSLAIEGVTAK